jgi:CubicO group peptidase (beta-lactamase class C family)
MQSGIPDFSRNYDEDGHETTEVYQAVIEGVSEQNSIEENRAALREWILSQDLLFEQGERFSYCNSNYFLLARIVEQVSGMAYEDFLRQNIFEPLHMTHTGFIDDGLDNPRLAKNAQEAQTVYVGITMGLGDLVTNAADMQRWMASFSGNTLLSAESIAAMTADAGVGYGFTYRVPKQNIQIATVPIGYADGLSRTLSNRMDVLCGGARHRQVGNICMDQFMFAVEVNTTKRYRPVSPVDHGDLVTIIGTDGEDGTSVYVASSTKSGYTTTV